MRILSFIAVLLSVPALAAGQDAAATLDDIGTRLQFDFYTADHIAIERDLASVTALAVPADLVAVKGVFAGFGAWKRAELLRAADPGKAAESARNCTDELERTVKLEPKRGALHAMLSACQRLVAELQGFVKAPLASVRARQSLERAVQLAPQDPHVLLVQGSSEFEQVRAGSGDVTAARAYLIAATAGFEARATTTARDSFATAMSWGDAETWDTLGQLELAQGDRAAARDAFERALALVGDYRDAQQHLQAVTGERMIPGQ